MAMDESAILYLERNNFYFSDGSKIARFDFTPDMVRDFDIVNEELLIKSLNLFIEKSNFNSGKFILVLAESAIFVAGSEEGNVSLIPYNNVLSKSYKSKDGDVIIATNQDLIDILSNVFTAKGFGRDEIVPSLIFGQYGAIRQFDLAIANTLIKNQEMATGKSMLDPIPVLQQPVSEVFKVTKGKSTMLPMLLGVFALMLVGLVLLLVFRK